MECPQIFDIKVIYPHFSPLSRLHAFFEYFTVLAPRLCASLIIHPHTHVHRASSDVFTHPHRPFRTLIHHPHTFILSHSFMLVDYPTSVKKKKNEKEKEEEKQPEL